MEAMVPSTPHVQLPPGFRFHPSDEELILLLFAKQSNFNSLPATIIAEIELCKFNPWELPSNALFGEEEWYFFTPRERKYPNGVRPNRMAASGFWKATGIDRPILTSSKGTIVGVKKALVFYEGKPPRGIKTDWIMHEYRLLDTMPWTNASSKRNGSMGLADWVLCRVRQKSSTPRSICEDRYGKNNAALENFPRADHKPISSTNPNHDIELLKATLFKDCPMLPFIFSSDQLDLSSMDTFCSTTSFEGSKASTKSNSKVSSEENLQVYIPFFDHLKSTRKRKAEEEKVIQPSKKIHEPKEKATYLSNDTSEMSFDSGYQSDQWNYKTEYQDLTRIAFT